MIGISMTTDSSARHLRAALLALLEADERSLQRLRVAMYVLANARYGRGRSTVIPIKSMASDLGLLPPNVSRALRALEGLKLWKVEKGKDARERSFYLVPIGTKKKVATNRGN
jgi:DNA-binding MarR family transcriptional regulator